VLLEQPAAAADATIMPETVGRHHDAPAVVISVDADEEEMEDQTVANDV
jgi:hypothetical protein